MSSSKNCNIRKRNTNRFAAFKMWRLRRILKKTWKYRGRNQDVLKTIKEKRTMQRYLIKKEEADRSHN